jgi:hypothetical protein
MTKLIILLIGLYFISINAVWCQQVAPSNNDCSIIDNELIIWFDDRLPIQQFIVSNNLYTRFKFVPKQRLDPFANIWLAEFSYESYLSDSITKSFARKRCLSHFRALNSVKMLMNNDTCGKLSSRTEPNDPRFPDQWNLDKVQLPEAWNKYGTGGKTKTDHDVVVAVLDVGFTRAVGDDISLNYWSNSREIPGNLVDDDGNGYVDDVNGWNAFDDNGTIPSGEHGTQVSSVIGAIGNNLQGISGSNWNIKILPINVGSPISRASAISGYRYARNLRNQFNLTGGSAGAYVVAANSSFSWDTAFEEADYCSIFEELDQVGTICVSSITNRLKIGVPFTRDFNIDRDGDLPAHCSHGNLVAVGSSTSWDGSSSPPGVTNVDMAAPGHEVWVLSSDATTVERESGSSYAAPLVAGTIGLMYSAACRDLIELSFSQPRLVCRIFRDALLNGTDRPWGLCEYVKDCRRLNALKAIDLIETPLSDEINLTGSESGTLVQLAGKINASPRSTYLIRPSARVELLASDWVNFFPGFDTEAGAYLDAQIFDPKCYDRTGTARIGEDNSAGEDMNIDSQSLIHSSNNKHPYVLSEAKIYPSPFTESFSLSFTIAADARVTVELCNALGQTIRTCCDNTSYAAGSHTLNIDGRGLAGGTYFAKILIDGAVVKTVPVMKIDQ